LNRQRYVKKKRKIPRPQKSDIPDDKKGKRTRRSGYSRATKQDRGPRGKRKSKRRDGRVKGGTSDGKGPKGRGKV